MGPSGSGKSTLLHCLAGLDRLTSGQIYLGDVEISALQREGAHAHPARPLGFIFQAYNLIPTLNALENITLPMALAGKKPDPAWLETIVDDRRACRTASRTARPSCRVVSSSASPSARALAERARDHLRRRAHRQPRLALGRRDPHVHAQGGRRARPDDRDGHPRPDRGGVRRPRRVPRRRHDRRRDARADRRLACSTR